MARGSRMTNVRAKIKLRRILQTNGDQVRDAMKDSANMLQKEMQRRAPEDSGLTADDITAFVSKGKTQFKAEVGFRGNKKSSRRYIARFIEFGTKAHKITTKKKALTAEGDIFGKEINHPGTPARPFIGPTWDFKKPDVIARVAKAVNDTIKKAQQ